MEYTVKINTKFEIGQSVYIIIPAKQHVNYSACHSCGHEIEKSTGYISPPYIQKCKITDIRIDPSIIFVTKGVQFYYAVETENYYTEQCSYYGGNIKSRLVDEVYLFATEEEADSVLNNEDKWCKTILW